MTIAAFEADMAGHLQSLSQALLDGTYRPKRLRRAHLPKADGGWRALAIPAVVDRVAQTAMLLVCVPYLDPRMSDASWAYRPGRGVAGAIAQANAGFRDGFVWTVDADITRYFDLVPHARMIAELTIWIDDERIIQLVGKWLRGFSRLGIGIAQGAPVSPLLANLYLHPIDRLLVSEGFHVVRYSDDLVVQAKSEADGREAQKLLSRLLNGRGLSLNRAKTRLVGPDEPFVFLGQTLDARSIQSTVAAIVNS